MMVYPSNLSSDIVLFFMHHDSQKEENAKLNEERERVYREVSNPLC